MEILTYGNKVLRKKAKAVAQITPDLKALAQQMLEQMYKSNGIGLAAPQIGHSIRLIVVDVEQDSEKGIQKPYIFFNPEIIDFDGAEVAEEGCLSVPGVYAEVQRPESITLRALDGNGTPIELKEIKGLFARCIQHEIDHLNGVLFVDKISALEKQLNSTKLKKLVEENL